MVATRRSLGGQPSPTTSSPPTAAPPPQLSRAQQAALKKLDIAGTDALKGDAKAAAAAKAAVQTYHYRGAVYAADANTPSSWIENQPKRYLKRGRGGEDSTAVEGEEEEDDDEEEEQRPAKRRNHKPAPPRGTARGRQSLPAKKKAAALDDEDDDILSRPPSWLPGSAPERRDRLSQRANASPAVKSPIPDNKTMDSDIQRRKQEAVRKRYQVQALGEDDLMSEKALARIQLVRLAKKQKLLNEKIIEWKMAKELLEYKKKEAGIVDLTSNDHETAQTNVQPTIDLTRHDSSQKGDDHELGEQWEREQEQNRIRHPLPPKPDFLQHSPAALQRPTNPAPPHLTTQTIKPTDPQTTAGAPRPQTPTSTILTGANAYLHPSSKGYTPSTAPAPTITATTPSTGHSNHLANPASTPGSSTTQVFDSLPPDSALPTTSVGGDFLRWTIKRRASVDVQSGEERAEYAIDVARLEGESKSAKVRRVRRERAVCESWARVTGGVVVEEGGRRE